ncbi:DUF4097 family beta strand repeat-containing protein [Halorussus marinus]|uniref:DUF4097 family beta strand repeat-containing protein n=1 Tax=Halorussus marinus TaxID=2505976 RepID=UPI0014318D4D|nr:DUF4097 family beta strand repeat-containing protein [Halorussus marinus]
MTRTTDRRRFLAAGASAALVGLSGCTGATPFVGKRLEETHEFDVGDGNSLAIDADNGDVTVRSGSPRLETVKKSGSVFADLSDASVDVGRDGDTVRVEARTDDDGSWFQGTPAVDVTADIPDGVTVDAVRTRNGDADVRGVTGDATVESRNGDAVARNVDGEVTVQTDNGDAEARDISGYVTAQTENGDAVARNVGGLDGASSENGDVDVEIPSVRGDTSVETDNGDVEAAVSPDVDARLVLRTDRGDVSIDGPFDVATRTDEYAEAGPEDADAELRLRSDNGDVSVTALD